MLPESLPGVLAGADVEAARSLLMIYRKYGFPAMRDMDEKWMSSLPTYGTEPMVAGARFELATFGPRRLRRARKCQPDERTAR